MTDSVKHTFNGNDYLKSIQELDIDKDYLTIERALVL